jgi:hypothetical protein
VGDVGFDRTGEGGLLRSGGYVPQLDHAHGSERAKRWQARMHAKHGPGKTLGILAAKLGRTVYHLWRTQQVFDEARFFAS